MTEAEWLACDCPQKMVFQTLASEEISSRRVGLFLVACCSRLGAPLSAGCCRVIETVEDYHEGKLPHEEVRALFRAEQATLHPPVSCNLDSFRSRCSLKSHKRTQPSR